jgi:hypothetical protein
MRTTTTMEVSIPAESGTAERSNRTAYLIFDLEDPTVIPSLPEPFLFSLLAELERSPEWERTSSRSCTTRQT